MTGKELKKKERRKDGCSRDCDCEYKYIPHSS